MAIQGQGMHHLSLRKRVHQKREKYPSEKKKIRVLDKLIYVVGILGPVMSIPQIIKIFYLKNADGVSLITYAILTIFSFVWLYYGIVHKEKPIIANSGLWVIAEVLILIGIILYGNGFW